MVVDDVTILMLNLQYLIQLTFHLSLLRKFSIVTAPPTSLVSQHYRFNTAPQASLYKCWESDKQTLTNEV